MARNGHTAGIVKGYHNIFRENESVFFDGVPDFLREIRKKAMARFRKTGLPGRKNEHYKYTDLEPVFRIPFQMKLEPSPMDFRLGDIFQCDVPDLNTNLEAVVNGFYFPVRNRLREEPNGIIRGSLAEAIRQHPGLVRKYLSQHEYLHRENLASLNDAFAQDGLFMYIPEGKQPEKPVQLVHLHMGDQDAMFQYRNLIVLEKGASAKILICDHTLSSRKFLTNSVTEIHAAENSEIDYIRIQNEHLASNLLTNLFIRQKKGSRTTANNISLHGGLIRNNIYVHLDGENARNNTYGLSLADKSQHIDNYVFIDHSSPDCTSRQLFKSILDEMATGAFSGRILVNKEAQKTNAYQASNNILMTDDARMNTRPQLEIYADNVKCSHGATVGQLDQDALFYLHSRGIPNREAVFLMLYAFAWEIIQQIPAVPLRKRIGDLVDKRLRGELSRCNRCPMNCNETEQTK